MQERAGVSDDRIVTREILNDWICNDGLEHLFAEGYLSYEVVDPADVALRSTVALAHGHWKAYEEAARRIQELVDEVMS